LTQVHRYAKPGLRDERLPKGPRFASESLDADTSRRSVSKLTNTESKNRDPLGSRLAVIYDD